MAKILIIDDVLEIRSFLRIILTKAGHQVVDVANGNLGLEAYKSQPADLVLCDLFMPEKEGLDTIRELQALNSDVKIIAMSGGSPRTSFDFLTVAAKLGASKTLNKPLNTAMVLGAVEEVLKGSPQPSI
jgi:DNA-binding NtrC family response regulator